MALKGFNFRDTSTYVTDPVDTSYVISTDTYPTSRNDVTFGRDGFTFVHRNRSTSNDPRLAGLAQAPNNDTSNTFNWRFDLPQPGTYNISLAAGDASFTKNNYIRIYDDLTLVATIAAGVATAANQFVDASGAVLSAADWPSQNSTLEIQFSSTICNLRVGANDAGVSGNSAVAHFAFNEVTGISLTITDPIVPGTTTTFSTSGNADPWTGVRITDAAGNIKELTLASQTSVSAPAVGDLDYALFGDVTIEVYNATESATSTITFNPPAGFNQITLEAGFATDQESYLFNYGGTPDVPDQFTYDPVDPETDSELTLNTNGYWTSTGDGTWTIYGTDATDGFMETFPLISGDPVSGTSSIAKTLSKKPLTARSVKASGITIK